MNWHQLEEVFPTVIKYVGMLTSLVLTGTLIVAVFMGRGSEVVTVIAPGYVAATSMMLWKSVYNARHERHKEER